MQDVKISVSKLVPILQENLANHIKEYEEAVIDYKALCLKTLKEQTKKFKNATKTENLVVSLVAPQSHESDYKSVLRQLDLSFDTEVVLTDGEFSQYVDDDWGWKQQFTTSNAMYKTSLSRR